MDWRGFRSRAGATTLPPGVDRFAQNMRYNRNRKQPRAGSAAMATDLVLANPPVVLDFALPTSLPAIAVVRTDTTVRVTLTASPGWNPGDVVAVEGADQTEYNGDWPITSVGLDSGHAYFEFSIAPATPPSPATGTILATKGLRVFEIYADRARAACVFTDDNQLEHLLVVCGRTGYVLTEQAPSVKIDFPVGELIETGSEVDLQVYLNNLYLFRGRSAGPVLAIGSLSRVGGLVTVATSVHGLQNGDWVRIPDAAEVEYQGVWQVTVLDNFTFTFGIGAATPATPSASPGTVYKVRPPLKWDRDPTHSFEVVTTGPGPTTLHIRMPPADWALPFNDQIWLPLARDQMIKSDFNEDSSFDLQTLQRFKPGSADSLVAAYPGPLTDEPGTIGPRLFFLLRKSLFLLYLSPTDLSIIAKKQIPGSEGVGCRARRTVATCGQFVAWLSDQGVQLANLGQELALLTAAAPLSTNVQDLIERINWPFASNAVAAFHNNRYHLAVPLDDSTVNNAVFVFNFLNTGDDSPYGEWESVDQYPGDFDIIAFVVMNFQGRQRLHAISSTAYAYALEVGDQDEYGAPGGQIGKYDIEGISLGRQLLFGSLETKRFIAVRVDLDLQLGARAVVQFTTTNPDITKTLKDHVATTAGDETLSSRPRLGGISGAVDLHLPAGRPIIKAITVEAAGGQSNTRDKK